MLSLFCVDCSSRSSCHQGCHYALFHWWSLQVFTSSSHSIHHYFGGLFLVYHRSRPSGWRWEGSVGTFIKDPYICCESTDLRIASDNVSLYRLIILLTYCFDTPSVSAICFWVMRSKKNNFIIHLMITELILENDWKYCIKNLLLQNYNWQLYKTITIFLFCITF